MSSFKVSQHPTAHRTLNNENSHKLPKKQTAPLKSNRPRKVLSVLSNNDVNRQQRPSTSEVQLRSMMEGTKKSNQIKTNVIDEADEETEDDMDAEEEELLDEIDRKERELQQHFHETYAEADENEEEEEEEEEEGEYYAHDSEERNDPLSPKWDFQIKHELDNAIKKYHRTEPDPRDEDTWDVSMVAEYGPEIFNYMHKLEIKYAPNAFYIPDIQKEITWENRSTLINWIVQVHARFNLLPETLFLAVNLIDRFLSKRAISLSRFQLCGAISLFIAAKYEEINCPSVQQMAYMVSNDYTIEELLKAERFMVNELKFEMGYPGPMSFLRRTSKADDYDSETRTLAKYFIELTIMDQRFVSAKPSWIAAGAHYLSRTMLYQGKWTEAHVFYSGFTETQLAPLADILIECCANGKEHHKAIFDKYSERRFKRCSIFVQEYIRERF